MLSSRSSFMTYQEAQCLKGSLDIIMFLFLSVCIKVIPIEDDDYYIVLLRVLVVNLITIMYVIYKSCVSELKAFLLYLQCTLSSVSVFYALCLNPYEIGTMIFCVLYTLQCLLNVCVLYCMPPKIIRKNSDRPNV
jgi:hypothetical protein